MSDEEDNELALLRSAALASIKKKTSCDHNETEDLETLRKMALTSRKFHIENENLVAKKREAIKISNLINLTPVARESSGASESDQEDFHSRTSASEESEIEKSSSSEDDSTEGERQVNQTSAVPVKKEVKTEEDDLLSAIDQFLDEGVIMLEQVAEISPPPKESKKKKTAKLKTKKKKESTATSKAKKIQTSKKVPSTNRKKKADIAVTTPEIQPKLENKPQRLRNPRESTQFHKDSMSTPVVWNSADLPLREKAVKQNVDSDSVHSSDLSFLSNADNENNAKDDDQFLRNKPERKFIRINRHKLDELKKETNESARRFSGEDPVPVHDRETRNEKRLQRSVRHERKLPDLRDKLKRRGLLRRNRSEEKEKKESASGLKESENGAYNVSHKIYVKPSVVFDESSLKKTKEELPRTLTDRLVTRRVMENNFSPLQIKLTDREEKRNIKSFRRKRSVVQYKPDESPTEKQQRLEKIKKNAQEAALAVESLSDLSEDFDDFEIEEPKEISFPENIGTPEEKKEKAANAAKSVPKTHVAISSTTLKNPEEEKESLLSDYDEEADEELGEIKDSPRRSSSSSDGSEENISRFRSKIQVSKKNTALGKHFKRRNNVRPTEPVLRKDRAVPRRPEYDSRIGWRDDRNRQERDDFAEKSTLSDDRNSYKRSKRKRSPNVREFPAKKSVKHRLGVNKVETYARSLKRSDSREFAEKTADREKVVDARIRRIEEQNARIKRRRRLIEEEEQAFRLKPA